MYNKYAEKYAGEKGELLEKYKIGSFDPEKHEKIGEFSIQNFFNGNCGVLHSTQFRANTSPVVAFVAVPVSYKGSKIMVGKGISQFEKINWFRKMVAIQITGRVLKTPVGITASKIFNAIAQKLIAKAGSTILGGSIGSTIPVAGTFIGAAAAWIATDYVMKCADEYVTAVNLRRRLLNPSTNRSNRKETSRSHISPAADQRRSP